MNKRALLFGLAYSISAIAFKLYILLSGNSFSRFGFFYAQAVSVFLFIPFYYLAIKITRDKDYGGVIGGREGLRLALTVFVVGIILCSIYHYFEFEFALKDLTPKYYNSQQFLEFLRAQKGIKPEKYKDIIQEMIASASAFRAVTAKLISYMVIGVGTAFITAVMLKRKPVAG